MPKDDSKVGGSDAASVQEMTTISKAEYDALRSHFPEVPFPNTAPAIEEGPHLKEPDVRAAKLQQMTDAGLTVDADDLTDDMRDILAEG